jgi:hypothetical protein
MPAKTATSKTKKPAAKKPAKAIAKARPSRGAAQMAISKFTNEVTDDAFERAMQADELRRQKRKDEAAARLKQLAKKPAKAKPASKKAMLFAPSGGSDLEAKVKLKAAQAVLAECWAPKATNVVAKAKAAHAIIGQVISSL